MGRVKENLTILKVLWIIWVWEPIREAGKLFFQPLSWPKQFLHLWAVHLGLKPCCDNPDPKITIAGDTSVEECKNCGHIRTAYSHFF